MINMENYIWLEGGWEREQMATKRILEQLIVTGIFPGEKFKSEAKQKHYPFFSAQGTVHGTAPAMLWLDEGGLPEMPSLNGINSSYPALNSSCSNADRNSWQGGENVYVPTVFWVRRVYLLRLFNMLHDLAPVLYSLHVFYRLHSVLRIRGTECLCEWGDSGVFNLCTCVFKNFQNFNAFLISVVNMVLEKDSGILRIMEVCHDVWFYRML